MMMMMMMIFFLFSTSNLDDLVKGIKMIAALMDDKENSKKLIDAAKALAQAFNDLLNSLNPNNEDKVMLKTYDLKCACFLKM